MLVWLVWIKKKMLYTKKNGKLTKRDELIYWSTWKDSSWNSGWLWPFWHVRGRANFAILSFLPILPILLNWSSLTILLFLPYLPIFPILPFLPILLSLLFSTFLKKFEWDKGGKGAKARKVKQGVVRQGWGHARQGRGEGEQEETLRLLFLNLEKKTFKTKRIETMNEKTQRRLNGKMWEI